VIRYSRAVRIYKKLRVPDIPLSRNMTGQAIEMAATTWSAKEVGKK
jgi:hypothetical protein